MTIFIFFMLYKINSLYFPSFHFCFFKHDMTALFFVIFFKHKRLAPSLKRNSRDIKNAGALCAD